MTTPRPRRSALYLPGNNERVLKKGASLPADAVILDLEDAVASDDKFDSRRRVIEAVSDGRYKPREVVVRVNGLDSEWYRADIAAVATSGADALLVPKVQSAEQVHGIVAELIAAGAPEDLDIWVMIETPAAFLHAEEIAAASPRLTVLVVGTNDLINDLHAVARPGRGPISVALTLAVLSARSAGKVVLDGVFNAIRDADGFATEAQQGRDMGFDGKTVVHPDQIGPANSVFGPTAEEKAMARAVVKAYEHAMDSGLSVAVLDGVMVEELHVRNARRILDLAALIDDSALSVS